MLIFAWLNTVQNAKRTLASGHTLFITQIWYFRTICTCAFFLCFHYCALVIQLTFSLPLHFLGVACVHECAIETLALTVATHQWSTTWMKLLAIVLFFSHCFPPIATYCYNFFLFWLHITWCRWITCIYLLCSVPLHTVCHLFRFTHTYITAHPPAWHAQIAQIDQLLYE